MKKWNIMGKWQMANSVWKIDKLLDLLLKNRGIKTKKDREEFLHPGLESVTPKSVGIDEKQLKKALKRIKKAIEKKEQIIVFGDYDVDGITGSAILWETIHSLGGEVLPYIPHRIEEGYGLSIAGIQNLESRIENVRLIITVDNGIVANEAVTFANKNNIDVIITDHHVVDKKVPDAYAIVHTTRLCGAGVAYMLAQELKAKSEKRKIQEEDDHLELAALGTVADMVPLTGANRAIVKYGLEKLPKTKRFGLQELYKNAGLNKDEFTPYDVGFIIAPRLNASGRIESAMDSLRLLCTTNRARAEELAAKLELVNKERQELLKEAKEHAIAGVRASAFAKASVDKQGLGVRKLLFVSHESYAQGVIGLVAGKLVEEFYRPAIVVSIGEKHSKASVRSVSGFNIIEFLRLHSSHFVNVGGHPMAAGFTVETGKIELLKKILEEKAEEVLTDEILTRSLKIDCELPFSVIDISIYDAIQQLAPFGMANPEPTFVSKEVCVEDIRIMGKDRSHLKLRLSQCHPEQNEGSSPSEQKTKDSSLTLRMTDKLMSSFEAVGFGMGELAGEIKTGDKIDVAYTLDENVWLAQRSLGGVGNGNTKLQLKVKDILKIRV